MGASIVHSLPAQQLVLLVLVVVLLALLSSTKFVVILSYFEGVLSQMLFMWHRLIECHRTLLLSLTLATGCWRHGGEMVVLNGTTGQRSISGQHRRFLCL